MSRPIPARVPSQYPLPLKSCSFCTYEAPFSKCCSFCTCADTSHLHIPRHLKFVTFNRYTGDAPNSFIFCTCKYPGGAMSHPETSHPAAAIPLPVSVSQRGGLLRSDSFGPFGGASHPSLFARTVPHSLPKHRECWAESERARRELHSNCIPHLLR